MGMHGTGHMTLAQQAGGRWVYSLRIGRSARAAVANTVFDQAGDGLRPLSGTDSSTFLVKRVTKQASYDWKRAEASWSGDVKPDRAGPVALGPATSTRCCSAWPCRATWPQAFAHYRMVDGRPPSR